MKKEVKIPEIAENVETAIVAGILVSEGDKVTEDQSLVEIETDKATTDLPAPVAGVIAEIKVKEGDEVKVDQVIMIIETKAEEEKEKEPEKKDEDGEKTEDKKEENEEEESDTSESEEDDDDDQEEEKESEPEEESKDSKSEDQKKDLSDIPASPSVRRLARELDVDLTKIKGTGPGNRITAEDVKSGEKSESKTGQKQVAELPDFSKWGNTNAEDMTTIRKITAKNVSQSWSSVPHVTQFDEADITDIENFRKENAEKFEKQGAKLTLTAILLKIAGFALQKFPRFNASIDTENDKIIYKRYFNIGIAADTPQGLLVPVVQDVNQKSLLQLASKIGELAEKARNKKLSPEEMQGGNFTISNLGGIGGTAFTPIVLPPQVAILGVSRASYKPVYNEDDQPQKRLILPLSLSYDHRVIDGADGARFLRWICDVLENPYNILQ